MRAVTTNQDLISSIIVSDSPKKRIISQSADDGSYRRARA